MNPTTTLKEAEEKLDTAVEHLKGSLPPGHAAGVVNRALERIQARPLITLGIATAIVIVVLIFGPAFLLGVKDAFRNRTIDKTKTEAAAEKTAAEKETISAGQLDAQRKAEDQFRETTLEPERQRTAETLEQATRRRRELESTYETNRRHPRRPSTDDHALRLRNCADLRELYPSERFAGCQ